MKNIKLKKKEKSYLENFVKKGSKSARALTRARILLFSNNKKTDTEITNLLGIGRTTVWRIKENYKNKGINSALTEKYRSGQPRKYEEKQRTEIVAYACTNPPEGRKRWTVRLLAEELCKQKGFETINRETIRLVLKKTKLNLG